MTGHGLRIDLHAHSDVSDGSDPPATLMRRAVEAGLDVVALTDHDTTAGWSSAADAVPAGVTLVRGAEVSCTYVDAGREVGVHLLAYLFDPAEPRLAGELARLRDSRRHRAARMVDRLTAAGHPVRRERVVELAGGGTVGRPHVARALVEAGVVGSVDEAFTSGWIGTGGAFWEPKAAFDLLDAVRLVRDAGGVSVLAHPYGRSELSDDLITAAARAGLDGLEADHPQHGPAERARARRLAADLDLVITGSSDYHGRDGGSWLGAELTDPAAYERLVSGASGVPPYRCPS